MVLRHCASTLSYWSWHLTSREAWGSPSPNQWRWAPVLVWASTALRLQEQPWWQSEEGRLLMRYGTMLLTPRLNPKVLYCNGWWHGKSVPPPKNYGALTPQNLETSQKLQVAQVSTCRLNVCKRQRERENSVDNAERRADWNPIYFHYRIYLEKPFHFKFL